MKTNILKWMSITGLVLSCVFTAFSAGEKERMLQRVPKIQELKAAGVVGEKADGLLGFVKASPADKALVNAENKDRKAVYAAIAEGQGVNASVVGQRRALQLVGQASKGDWLQDKASKWYQKK